MRFRTSAILMTSSLYSTPHADHILQYLGVSQWRVRGTPPCVQSETYGCSTAVLLIGRKIPLSLSWRFHSRKWLCYSRTPLTCSAIVYFILTIFSYESDIFKMWFGVSQFKYFNKQCVLYAWSLGSSFFITYRCLGEVSFSSQDIQIKLILFIHLTLKILLNIFIPFKRIHFLEEFYFVLQSFSISFVHIWY